MKQRLKVLISAYACEPNMGSEPGVAWNWIGQIAEFAEVWVITRANNRPSIEKEAWRDPFYNVHFIYVDLPMWLRFWKRKEHGLYFYYFIWQILSFFKAYRLKKKFSFDIFHHLTFGNFCLPTFIPFLSNRFVWGPVGGVGQIPKSFRKGYSLKGKLQVFLRDVILTSLKFNILFRYICKKSRVIIAKNDHTLSKIPIAYRNKVVVVTDVGVPEESPIANHCNKSGGDVQIICVGRLIHWRGFDLAIKGFSKAVQVYGKMNLLIIGEGPDRHRLERICRREGIARKVTFTGRVSREQLNRVMSTNSILLNPCLREGGVTILFDAMLAGLPVICLDIGGSTQAVQTGCGIKIKPETAEQTIEEISESLLILAKDPDVRKEMGEAGQKRIREHFSWRRKKDLVRDIYKDIMNHD